MESTLSAAATLSSMSKTLNSCLHRHLWATRQSQCLRSQLVLRRLVYSELRRSKRLSCDRQSPHWGWSFCAVPVPAGRSRLECRASSAAASFSSAAYGGGGGGIRGSGGGDGDGASDGGEAKSDAVAGGSEDVSALSPDVIILDVGGMTCGGCAASVKRILESQPQVSSASVNLTTETAIVWPASEAKVIPNWQKHLGEILAKHLTSCGFKSNLRGQEAIEGDIPS